MQMDQPSLGMPSRDFYLDASGSKFKDAYLRYMVDAAVLMGADPDTALHDMTQVLEFETKVANVSNSVDVSANMLVLTYTVCVIILCDVIKSRLLSNPRI